MRKQKNIKFGISFKTPQDSFPQRVEALLKKKGDHIKYCWNCANSVFVLCTVYKSLHIFPIFLAKYKEREVAQYFDKTLTVPNHKFCVRNRGLCVWIIWIIYSNYILFIFCLDCLLYDLSATLMTNRICLSSCWQCNLNACQNISRTFVIILYICEDIEK